MHDNLLTLSQRIIRVCVRSLWVCSTLKLSEQMKYNALTLALSLSWLALSLSGYPSLSLYISSSLSFSISLSLILFLCFSCFLLFHSWLPFFPTLSISRLSKLSLGKKQLSVSSLLKCPFLSVLRSLPDCCCRFVPVRRYAERDLMAGLNLHAYFADVTWMKFWRGKCRCSSTEGDVFDHCWWHHSLSSRLSCCLLG